MQPIRKQGNMTAYITTPIYYVNAQPHLGHAYTTIVADTYSRFRRLCGDKVRFQTGTDEHGDKIADAAQKDNKHPQEYVDTISAMFQDTWEVLKIYPDNFVRTTDAHHIRTVQRILQQVYENGDIYFDTYSGLYCKGCERFLTEKELVDGNCPDHQVPPQEISEQNYFFRMSKYQQRLIAHIQKNPEFITPERYRNEVLSFLSEPLEDLCISRPVSRLTWGIPLPFDTNFVTYVWFDALINYLSGIGYPDGEDFFEYWPVAEHLIAKDILKPHAIYWPTMLMAIGLEPYAKLHVHGYWNVDNTKMSKSIGNVLRPAELVEEYGRDALRYFILREMSFGLDASFSHDAIVARKNSDLANDLGNLFSRSLAMLQKYCDGKVPAAGNGREESDEQLVATAEKMLKEYRDNMRSFQFHKGLQAVWELVAHANKYIVVNEPWALAKDVAQKARLDTVLYHLVESLRLLALVVSPVMPETAANMIRALDLEDRADLASSLVDGGRWGVFPQGRTISATAPLFPRVDVPEKKLKKPQESSKGKTTAVAADGLITFDQFKKIELKVAEILTAEKIEQSEKLLLLTVMAHEKRTVVAGIAEHYGVGELIGKKVILVANMKPAKIMGYASEGMLLAAKTEERGEERLTLVTVSDPVRNGSIVA
jgi:methionyl-tRNA synthetase